MSTEQIAPPQELIELIARFKEQADDYRAGKYNETQVRREFIDKLFGLLGWDVDNKHGCAEQYKDVIHEDAIRVGGLTKAPDYCFRIGGTRKFFVEAKKPSVNVREDVSAAYQVRRYAWSAKLPLSILTDFEEFAVYDCRKRPEKGDSAATGRILYMTYTEYAARWAELATTFSKDAILRGAFDRFAESTKGKRGTTEVDAAFLSEIESWRDVLARHLALRNPALTQRELNFAVQRTIDRIIFLRICEDRAIEPYGQLQALVNGPNIYPRLCAIFERADERYNSGLFHFHSERGRFEAPDELSKTLAIDDKVLRDILRRLYYPESPYEFSVLPADILGQVYEQFLGKVIRLTPGHQAKVEEKPEVKKAGGVYYTPTYIVDYIVRHTVGKLLEGGTPKSAAELRILDPACGSGSFLIGAYQHLLDWHLQYYLDDGPEKHSKGRDPALVQTHAGWKLTTAERKRILLNNIYGVDIDSQAVEVTKLSLLLKVLEGETEESINAQISMFRERALPDLGSNIKCGNSLIGPDFYTGQQQLAIMDEEEMYRINVFDWNSDTDGFGMIMKAGGFDAVIGNPPYIRVRLFKELCPEQVGYLESNYRCAVHVWDIYLLFMEKVLALLSKGGRFSFIVPIQTLHQPNCESLREMLLAQTAIDVVADLSGLNVFRDAIVKNCILVCEKGNGDETEIKAFKPTIPEALLEEPWSVWPQKMAAGNAGHSLKVDLLSPTKVLCDKLKLESVELGAMCYVTFGMRSCAKGKGQGGKDRLITDDPSAPNAKPYLEGRDINRYRKNPTGRFLRYEPEDMYSPRVPELFDAEKIVSQTMLSKMRLVATYDADGYYVEQSLLCIIPHGLITPDSPAKAPPLKFILGVMNSTLESFYFRTAIIDYSLGGGLVHATPGSQSCLIIPEATEADVAVMVSLVEQMLDLNKRLASANTEQEKTVLKRQIDATDRQIDALVYELYGLTEEEIALVEKGG